MATQVEAHVSSSHPQKKFPHYFCLQNSKITTTMFCTLHPPRHCQCTYFLTTLFRSPPLLKFILKTNFGYKLYTIDRYDTSAFSIDIFFFFLTTLIVVFALLHSLLSKLAAKCHYLELNEP